MKKHLFPAICLCMCLLYQGALLATPENPCTNPIIYVDKDATGNNDGTSWSNAYSKLQDALLTACSCSVITQIWVADGTYYPDEGTAQTNNLRTSSFQLCNNKAVYGGFNGTETTLSQRDWVANVTTLSGDIDQVAGSTNNAYHVLIGSGTTNTAILDGFTVTGGNANGGGANNNGGGMVNLSGSPTLRNMKFTGNQATTLGGAMHNSLSSPIIQNSTFITNTSSLVGGAINAEVSSHMTVVDCDFISNTGTINGGAISLSQSNPVIRDCRFIGNTSQEGGGIYAFRMTTTITNCLFSGNRATNRGAGLHLTTDSNSKLLNCTITGNNSTGNGGGILLWNTPNLTLINTIIHNNQAAGSTTSTSASIFRDNAIANFSYCLVANSGGSGSWNATIGTNVGNNVDTNPLFVLPVNPATAPTTAGNLQLTGLSPLNIGSNAAYDVVGDPQNDLDLANNPRVFEYSIGGIIDMGAYEFQGQSSCPGGSIVYVNASASGTNNGTSWTNAYTKLQDALLTACSCTGITQIWVAAGTYYPDEGAGQTNNNRNSSFQLCNGKEVYGGFNGTETALSQRNWEVNETILSGNIDGVASTSGNAYHVVLASNTNNAVLLDGFTITEGNANGTVVPLNRGGGVYKENGAAKFRHIYFTLNLAGDGASYYSLSGSSTLTDCIFENNFGSVVVGGVVNQASPAVITRCHFINNRGGIETAAIGNTAATVTIVDCSFIGNEAGVGNGNAGAIHSWNSTVNIYNCLFSGNKATRHGGAIFNTFNTVANIVNCTFSGNRTTQEGGAIFNEQNATANVRNSIIWNNQAGSSTTSTSASVFNSTATTNVYYSLVANSGGSGGGWQSAIGVDGGNNIATDALFVLNVNPATAPTFAGDLHVQTSSPAINAGNNSYNTQPFDLDGNARIANDVIDMGAFEHFIACTPITWYLDADGDGYGDPGFSLDSCDLPAGYVNNNQDCDDTSGNIHPGAAETCNDLDDDCDGLIDEDLQMYTYYQDADDDGYGNELVFITSCDTVPQEGYVTGYGNGPFGGGEGGGGEGEGGGGNGGGEGENYFDSDDTNPFVNPGMEEICNGIDDDSDGLIDEGVMSVFYADADGDTYGNLFVDTMACTAPVGFVANSEDCDDTNPNINPAMQETCNGLDDDCDGLVDDTDPGVIDQGTWYADTDQDGYGNPADSIVSCYQPSGYIDNSEDCDDTNADIHPGAEICNGIDDDCDGIIDDGLSCQGPDGDGDGIEDEEDNCVSTENPNQEDSDCDGVGDACDVCPGGDDGVDMDNDGLPDCHYLPAYADILSSWKCSANKVFIAHQSGGGAWQTLCLNYNAAQAHINHGDYLGPVDNSQCSQNFMVPGFEYNEVDGSNATLELFPNPVSDELTIHLHDIKGWSELVVADQLGRILFTKVLQPGDDIIKLDVRAVEFNGGIYSAIVNNGSGVLVSRFVVTR